MNSFTSYLSVLADSDVFGALATISFLTALAGMNGRVRASKVFKSVVFLCLMFMPILHLIGTYYLNKPPA